MPERAMVLLSGGVDSTTLLHVVKHQLDVPEIVAVSFLYAQKHERELAMARHQAAIVGVAEHRELDLSILGAVTANRSALTGDVVPMPNLEELTERQRSQPPTYVPHRNLLFLSLAAATAEGLGMQDVYYGAQAQDEYGYWDCTTAFVEQLN
ncbi:MAG: 7-cyano-7-deazaguanine synthase, partial [Verrucomicrobia bacterium]|nr:7-cyano-7-deazaguanine synthase [Verrucomicrobiota bacterium]